MSIRARIEDAMVLWKHNRREGAWVMALTAVAGTARKRYPRPISDNQAFRSFIRDVTPKLMLDKPTQGAPDVTVVFDTTDKTHPEDMIYNDFRCHLFHEGTLSRQVALSESRIVDGEHQGLLNVRAQEIDIPDFFVLRLMDAVREAPENKSEFGPAT